MHVSMYETTVPVMIRGLGILSTYLDKASAFAADNNINPAVLVQARLAPDMLSLAGQVQCASDAAKGAVARLSGKDVPSFPDTETTLEQLQERIEKTVAFLKSVAVEQFEGSDARLVEMKFRSGGGVLSAKTYILQVALPNFFFHIATAHGILRHNGLKIGKKDYFGDLDYVDTKT